MCKANGVQYCNVYFNTDYKYCMRIRAIIYCGTEDEVFCTDCFYDVSHYHKNCDSMAMYYFDKKLPF